MIKIALLCPSYKRSDKLVLTIKEWINFADKPDEVEMIVGLDDCDPTIIQYYTQCSKIEETKKLGRFEVNVGPTTTGIQCCNRIVKTISPSTEFIMVVADDTGCIQSWDTKIFEYIKGFDNFKEPKYLVVSDGIWNRPDSEGPPAMHPYYFANTAFYKRIGYIMSEEYVAMYADNDTFAIAAYLNCIVDARALFFEHRHWRVSGRESGFDETYERRNKEEDFVNGLRIFLNRKARNFDLEA